VGTSHVKRAARFAPALFRFVRRAGPSHSLQIASAICRFVRAASLPYQRLALSNPLFDCWRMFNDCPTPRSPFARRETGGLFISSIFPIFFPQSTSAVAGTRLGRVRAPVGHHPAPLGWRGQHTHSSSSPRTYKPERWESCT
jgi:hypothetical protein